MKNDTNKQPEQPAVIAPGVDRVQVLNLGLAAADAVAQLEVELFDKATASNAVPEMIAAREADIYEQVCMEKDGDKPKYGNDGARKAAAAKIAAADAVLVTARQTQRDNARDMAVLRQRISNLNARRELYRAFLRGGIE